ncbi:MAG: DUF2158 domain-containing protein [Aestuariivita sp.]|nr:DUF2158 domain-containing protein [Aestuariivita sp.]MCY4202455.1 DUF2158 domain-containing protein [Aestuariivita sp.]
MEEKEIVPGDVVQIKSGGELMTVSEVIEDNLVRVTWMDKNGEIRRITLLKHVLHHVDQVISL